MKNRTFLLLAIVFLVPFTTYAQTASFMPPAAEPFPREIFSCMEDSDCVVRNLTNCCGVNPVCVNKDAGLPDPEGVRRFCAERGLSSVCGFTELSGCLCTQGACTGISANPDPGEQAPDVR